MVFGQWVVQAARPHMNILLEPFGISSAPLWTPLVALIRYGHAGCRLAGSGTRCWHSENKKPGGRFGTLLRSARFFVRPEVLLTALLPRTPKRVAVGGTRTHDSRTENGQALSAPSPRKNHALFQLSGRRPPPPTTKKKERKRTPLKSCCQPPEPPQVKKHTFAPTSLG